MTSAQIGNELQRPEIILPDNIFEQFRRLFSAVRRESRDNPQQIVNHYWEHKGIKTAVDDLWEFLYFNDFDRLLNAGVGRQFGPTPRDFENTWAEFKQKWLPVVCGHKDDGYRLDIDFENNSSTWVQSERPRVVPLTAEDMADSNARNRFPDFESEEEFDPWEHDGGAIVDALLQYLAESCSQNHERVDNLKRIAVQALAYLSRSTGLNFRDVFRRWNSIPPILYPRHVLNRIRSAPHASTVSLIDDAMKAYVFGARAAAIAMCRAALEDVLKRNYGKGAWDNFKLGKIVAIAAPKYRRYVSQTRLSQLVQATNGILHNYGAISKDAVREDEIVLDYLLVVKSLIEHAPEL